MVRLYVVVSLVVVVACGLWIDAQRSAVRAAEEQAALVALTGYRVAVSKIAARRALVVRATERHVRAMAATDTALAEYQHAHDAVAHPVESVTVVHPRTLVMVGAPLMPVDSVVTLGYVRDVMARADTVVTRSMTERATANARIVILRDVVAAQDTALARADTAIGEWKKVADRARCQWMGISCPSRWVSFGIGLAIPVLMRLAVR
jgi:hypothetical protein